MKRYNVFKQILVCIALLSCMACSGLNSKNSNNNGKMDTTFIWRAFVSSPKFYPMEVMYANVRLGNTDEWGGTMERFTGAGLGEHNGVVDTSSESEDGKLPMPSAIDVLWLSHTEKKSIDSRQSYHIICNKECLRCSELHTMIGLTRSIGPMRAL